MNPTVAGALEIQLLANLARLQKDMNEAKSIVGGAMKDIERTVGKMKELLGGGFVAAGFVMVAKQAMEAEQAVNRLNAVITATGNASGYTASQLHEMADAMAEASQFEDEDIRGAIASFLKFGNVHGDVMKRALKVTADYAAFTGTNMAAASETLGKAISSPAQGIERLQRAIGYLNPAQVEAIKNMQEMGDTAGAQSALLAILEQKIGGVAETMNTGYTKAFGDAKKATGEFFETLGGTAAVTVPVQSFLKFAADSMRDMKAIIEDGDWVQAAKFLMGFRQTDEQAAARKPASNLAPNAEAEAAAALEAKKKFDQALADQDARAIAHQLKEREKANKEWLAHQERTRDLDIKGWVAYIEARQAEDEEALRATGRLVDEERRIREQATDSLKGYVEQLEFERALIGRSNVEREIAIRLRNLERAGVDTSSESMQDYVKRLREALTAQEGLRLEQEAMRTQVSVWADLSKAASSFFVDLATNGREAFSSLRDWAKRFLAELLAIFAQKWILNLGASLVGGAGGGALSTAAGQVGQGTLTGAASSYIGSLLTGTGTVGTAIGQTGIMQLYGGATGAIQGPGLTGAAGLGQQATGWASANLGALGIVGAIIAVGMWAMDLYKSGWRDTGSARDNAIATGGFSGIQQVDNRLLKMLGFSDRDAFTMSGGPIISRLFGWKQRQNDAFGVRGAFGPGGITGEQWQDWSQQGGLFRSDRRGTETAAFSTEQSAFFASVFKGIGDIVGSVGRAIGADPAAILANYSKPFNFQLNENGEPLSDEALQKLFGDYFGGVLQEQVAMVFDAGGRGELAEYVKALKGSGEEITGFIVELVNVMGALDQANILGMSVEDLMKFKVEGESLAQTFERINGQWNQFQSLYVSDAERVDAAQKSLVESFKALGVEMPTSNAEFRKLVEGLDLSTEAGRKMFEGLMALAPAFAGVSNASAQLLAQFRQIAAARNPSLGRAFLESDLKGAVEEFMARNPWTNGMAWQEVARQINLITSYEGGAGDFGRYSATDRALILRILGITDDLNGLGEAAQEAARGLAGVGNGAQAANDWLGIKGGLWDYLRGLYTNPQLSPLPQGQQLETLKSRFTTALAQAQGGNIGAGQSLQGIIDQILQLGRGLYGSTSAYDDLFAWVTGLAGDFVMPGGAAELQRLAITEAQMTNTNLLAINEVLIQIRDNAWAAADAVIASTEESGEKVARAARSRVAVR